MASLPQLVRLVKILRMFEDTEFIEDGIDFESEHGDKTSLNQTKDALNMLLASEDLKFVNPSYI